MPKLFRFDDIVREFFYLRFTELFQWLIVERNVKNLTVRILNFVVRYTYWQENINKGECSIEFGCTQF